MVCILKMQVNPKIDCFPVLISCKLPGIQYLYPVCILTFPAVRTVTLWPARSLVNPPCGTSQYLLTSCLPPPRMNHGMIAGQINSSWCSFQHSHYLQSYGSYGVFWGVWFMFIYALLQLTQCCKLNCDKLDCIITVVDCTHNSHPLAPPLTHLWGWYMGCLLWVQTLICVLHGWFWVW